jgi:hypothetical protein
MRRTSNGQRVPGYDEALPACLAGSEVDLGGKNKITILEFRGHRRMALS